MAKTDIGPKISVEGEKEYRQQMQSIIQKQKEYAAELKSTMASMDKNTSAEQRASSVAAVLRKQIAAQTEAMNAQKEMLKKAETQYGSASNQASAYRTAVYKAAAELANLKSRLSDAENGLGEFADKAKDATDSLKDLTNTNAGANMFDGLQDAVVSGNIAADAFETITQKIIASGKKIVSTGIQYNAQLEQYQTALTNMIGSESDALILLDEIKDDAAKTPFDTAGLVKANELLVSTGISAEDSRRTILALGDAVSATGGGNDELSRMAQNLQQIQNAGKATSADIKQFAYAGIDVYGLLADYTGKTTEEIQKISVTYDLLSNALVAAAQEGGRYFNSMNTQSETLNGQWITLTDNATQLAGLMTQDLTEGVKILIGNMNDLTIAATEAYDSGGWYGLADAIASNIPIVAQLKTGFENATTAAINFLDKASYALNKGLGKDAYAGYNSYEDYKKEQDKKSKQTEQYRQSERERRAKLHQQRLKQAKAEKSQTYTVPQYTESGNTKKASGNTKKVAEDTKKLAKTVTDTSTVLVKGSENIVGAISRTTDTATKTYNVYDGTTKKLKGTTTETTQTITDSWTEMVNGIETQFKKVTTMTDGVVTDEKITSSAAKNLAKKSTHTGSTEYLTKEQAGIDNALGYISQTKETAQEVAQVYNEATGKMEESIVGTTETITQCYQRIQDNQLQTIQLQKTLVNGVETGSTEKILDAENFASNYTKNRTETMTAAEAGIKDAVGAVEVASKTATQTEKVLNKETGKMEEVVTGTTQTVTYSFERIVNGQKQAVEATRTFVNGVETNYSEVATDLETNIKYTEGVLGGFSKFVLNLDTKLGGLEKAASNLTKSPLGQWFSDLANGYRASDSFWDNIDVGSLITSGLLSFADGFAGSDSWQVGLAKAGLSVVGSLLGSDLSSMVNESNGWGKDLISGFVNGMKGAGGVLESGVKWVAETVSSFIHFSRPDKGPLRDYESWMPDMIQGMADGIKSNAYLLQDAAADLSGKLKMQLQYDVGSAAAMPQNTQIRRAVNMGGVTLNVYPSQNMDAEEFAQYTINRLNQMIAEEAAANGEVPVF